MSRVPSRFINRELSWLEFNQRDGASSGFNQSPARAVKFCIANSNLDEFFEVRIAGLTNGGETMVN
jgi:polyphosphate kinase